MGNIYGTSGNDSIYTDSKSVVYAGDGDDLLSAGGGNDTLYGNNGDDLLYSPGGGYRNVLTTLSGGGGKDTFVIPTSNDSSYSNSVIITDYEVVDNIDIIKDSSNIGENLDLNLVYYGSGSNKVTEIFNQENDDLIVTIFGMDHFYM